MGVRRREQDAYVRCDPAQNQPADANLRQKDRQVRRVEAGKLRFDDEIIARSWLQQLSDRIELFQRTGDKAGRFCMPLAKIVVHVDDRPTAIMKLAAQPVDVSRRCQG